MIFIDSNIPMYAAGAASDKKEACLGLLEKITNLTVEAASSAEVLQEILHRYRAIRLFEEGARVYDSFRALPIRWMDIVPEDVDLARVFLASHLHISSRDALHVAVMQRNGIKKIATYDQGFLGIADITVFLPGQVAGA